MTEHPIKCGVDTEIYHFGYDRILSLEEMTLLHSVIASSDFKLDVCITFGTIPSEVRTQ